MSKKHIFQASLQWDEANGIGTTHYSAYSRNYIISSKGKQDILGSSDPVFRGDGNRYNPEELLIASLSSCHMLWYLHLCADAGVVVTAYSDKATGIMEEEADGGGKFTEVVLNPIVTVKEKSMESMAEYLHQVAHQKCYIANSCNFPVTHKPKIKTGE
ncbi:MAG: OsmC family protein [Bacteroidia bacterium]